jgi:hypothetical protein
MERTSSWEWFRALMQQLLASWLSSAAQFLILATDLSTPTNQRQEDA